MNPFEILATLASLVAGLLLVCAVIAVTGITILIIRIWWGGRRARREYERRVGIRPRR